MAFHLNLIKQRTELRLRTNINVKSLIPVLRHNILNVVTKEVEHEIIRDLEGRTTGTVFHITRGTDVTDMVWKTIQPEAKTRNKFIMSYIEQHYPDYYGKIENGEATKADAEEIAKMGVQSAKDSFQRHPDLRRYGYKRSGSGASIVWTK